MLSGRTCACSATPSVNTLLCIGREQREGRYEGEREREREKYTQVSKVDDDGGAYIPVLP